jgi:hypothetical protein
LSPTGMSRATRGSTDVRPREGGGCGFFDGQRGGGSAAHTSGSSNPTQEWLMTFGNYSI